MNRHEIGRLVGVAALKTGLLFAACSSKAQETTPPSNLLDFPQGATCADVVRRIEQFSDQDGLAEYENGILFSAGGAGIPGQVPALTAFIPAEGEQFETEAERLNAILDEALAKTNVSQEGGLKIAAFPVQIVNGELVPSYGEGVVIGDENGGCVPLYEGITATPDA